MNGDIKNKASQGMIEFVIGSAGGIAGALAMSAVAMLANRAGILRQEPLPDRVEHRLEQQAGIAHKTDAKQEKFLAAGEHLAIGLRFGAAYAALTSRAKASPLLLGPLFGLGMYLFNVGGIGNILGLTPAPWEDDRRVVTRQVFMHLLYGTVTALTVHQIREFIEK